jgi:hypothetical protein
MRVIPSLAGIAALAFTLICANAYAQDNESTRNTLRGLKGVDVLIERLDQQILKDGLTVDSIRTDVELKLGLPGIRVLSPEERLKQLGSPYLHVNLGDFKREQVRYDYTIHVSFVQSSARAIT